MNQPANVLAVKIALVEGGKARVISQASMNIAFPIPAVGDEVGISDEAVKKAGLSKSVFMVKKRRHLLGDGVSEPSLLLFVV